MDCVTRRKNASWLGSWATCGFVDRLAKHFGIVNQSGCLPGRFACLGGLLDQWVVRLLC
jgi:hypothetical protein